MLTSWTLTCCDVLTRNSQLDSDFVLATLVRLSNVMGDASTTIHEPQGQTEQQRRLIMLGLEAQAQAIQQQIPPHILSLSTFVLLTLRGLDLPLLRVSQSVTKFANPPDADPVKILNQFAEVYIAGGALTIAPRPRSTATQLLMPTPSKLASSVSSLRRLLDCYSELDPATSFSSFTAPDWGRLTLCVVLAVRLSFRTPECPQFNYILAREELRLGEFLDHMCAETDLAPSNKQVDVFTATRVVLKVVRQKYDRRLEKALVAEALAAEALASQTCPTVRIPTSGGCPMLDGSLEQYFPIWDPSLSDAAMSLLPLSSVSDTLGNATRPVFHDLWATMTMGWADREDEREM